MKYRHCDCLLSIWFVISLLSCCVQKPKKMLCWYSVTLVLCWFYHFLMIFLRSLHFMNNLPFSFFIFSCKLCEIVRFISECDISASMSVNMRKSPITLRLAKFQYIQGSASRRHQSHYQCCPITICQIL